MATTFLGSFLFHLQWLDPSPNQILPYQLQPLTKAGIVPKAEDQAQGWLAQRSILGSRYALEAQNCHNDVSSLQKVPTSLLQHAAQESCAH